MGTARPVVAVAKHAALADRTSALLYEGNGDTLERVTLRSSESNVPHAARG